VFALVLAQLVGDAGLAPLHLGALHGGAEDELHPLLLQNPLEGLGDLAVIAGDQPVEILDHRDLGAEPGIDRAHLQPDHAAADDDHLLRQLLQLQRAGRGDNHLLVDLDALQAGGLGSARDDDVLRLVGLVADLDLARLGDRGPALQPGHLVLLEQEFDPLGVLADHIVLVGAHLRPIDLGLGGNPHLVEILLRLVQHVGGVQKRLRRDAAHVEAGAAQRLAPLDAGDLQAQLRRADGADIAAGARADDDEIELSHAGSPCPVPAAGLQARYHSLPRAATACPLAKSAVKAVCRIDPRRAGPRARAANRARARRPAMPGCRLRG
jgi:hypothetical protein